MKVFLLLLVTATTNGANILGIFPLPSKSHAILVDPILEKLATRGHNVTVITPYPNKKNIPNLIELDVSHVIEKVNMNFFEMRNKSLLAQMGMIVSFVDLTEFAMQVPATQKLLNVQDNHFDVIFSEVILTHPLMYGLSHLYNNTPVVALSTFIPNYMADILVGNISPPSYIPESMGTLSNPMTFVDRIKNYLFHTLVRVTYHTLNLPYCDRVMRRIFGDDLPPLSELMHNNTALVLANNHFSLGNPRPSVPNMIEIGGVHVQKPKPLPQDLQKYLDDAKEGVILFSLGSNAKSKDMGDDKIQSLLEAFSQIKLKVLWKFEKEDLPGKPDNVRIMKWLPQSDVLAHPNVKLLITHGGLLSTTEAVVRGIPIVGIPLAGDQQSNMNQFVSAGLGLSVELNDITTELMVATINEVLNNPKYTETAKLKQLLITDRPLEALDAAVYWIEYVIRHEGAPHLRVQALNLNWFQLNSIDVIAFLLVVSYVLVKIIIISSKFILRKLRKKTSADKKNN